MMERAVQIMNQNGLHARPAAEIVKVAAKFQAHITMVRDDLEVNGKSIMGVMMLAAEYGSTLLVRADGPDAREAVDAIGPSIYQRFGRLGAVSAAAARVNQEPAYARGYDDGFKHAQEDRQNGRRYDPVRHRDYRDGDQGFDSSYGSRDAYKDNYRAGFRAGYDAGYRDPNGARR